MRQDASRFTRRKHPWITLPHVRQPAIINVHTSGGAIRCGDVFGIEAFYVLQVWETQSASARRGFVFWSPAMSQETLEERVAILERQVNALLAGQSAQSTRVKNWRRTRGAFTGDDLMKQVFEEGHKIREAERKRAKARTAKTRQARK